MNATLAKTLLYLGLTGVQYFRQNKLLDSKEDADFAELEAGLTKYNEMDLEKRVLDDLDVIDEGLKG